MQCSSLCHTDDIAGSWNGAVGIKLHRLHPVKHCTAATHLDFAAGDARALLDAVKDALARRLRRGAAVNRATRRGARA